jgi:SAM-dependent methyltransferase
LSIRYGLPNDNEVLRRELTAALEPWFVTSRDKRHVERSFDVLEVGVGTDPWISSFDLPKTRFVGINVDEDSVRAARSNFPEGRFDLLGPDLLFPYEDEYFDLVFSVTFVNYCPEPAKRTLLSEMWRVTRPGGRLLFLEDFVLMRQPERPAVYPMSVTQFEDLILDATAGQVTLEHVESFRYPDESLHRGGLISLRRLGVSRK